MQNLLGYIMVVRTREVVAYDGTDHTGPVLSPAWRPGGDPSVHRIEGPSESEQGRHRGRGPCRSLVFSV
jgi:hypothetical protein